MRSLRMRLILSHILPLIVTVPLIGLALTYLIQTQILLTNLTQEVQTQAIFLVELTSQQINVWHSSNDAQAFVTRVSPMISSQIMLVDAQGKLLASNTADVQNDPINIEGMKDALDGETQLQVDRSLTRTGDTNVIQMLVPVIDENQNLLSHPAKPAPGSAAGANSDHKKSNDLGSVWWIGIRFGTGMGPDVDH